MSSPLVATEKEYCNDPRPDGLGLLCYLDKGHTGKHATEVLGGIVVEWPNNELSLLSRLEKESVARDERIAVSLESIASHLDRIANSLKISLR